FDTGATNSAPMRLQYLLVVALAVIAMCADASLPVNPNVLLDRSDVETRRILRAEKTIGGEDNEERGAMSNFANKIAKLFKSKKVLPVESMTVAVAGVPEELTMLTKAMPSEAMNKIDKLVKGINGKSLDDVYTAHVMEKLPLGKAFAPEALPLYVRYSEEAAKKTDDLFGVKTLERELGLEKLVKYIELGLKSKDDLAFATAERLRVGLVSKFWKEKKIPTDMAISMKGGNRAVEKVNKDLVKKYLVQHNTAYTPVAV
ncbi:hypothetical protein F442_00534, partial [Phytophthora nicotianae P10297]